MICLEAFLKNVQESSAMTVAENLALIEDVEKKLESISLFCAMNRETDLTHLHFFIQKAKNDALLIAAKQGEAEKVRVLLESGADYNHWTVDASLQDDVLLTRVSSSKQLYCPIDLAAMEGHLEVVKVLSGCSNTSQALNLAVMHGHLDIIELLWDKKDSEPLRLALVHNQERVVCYLLENGAKFDESWNNIPEDLRNLCTYFDTCLVKSAAKLF